MRRVVLGIVCILAWPALLGAQAPSPARVAQVVDSLAQAYVAERGAPSVAIAVVRGGQPIVMKGWGKADLENDVAATEHSVYRIGSVTKQFTAAAVMQLVEQGKVQLTDYRRAPHHASGGLAGGDGAAAPQPHLRHPQLHQRRCRHGSAAGGRR